MEPAPYVQYKAYNRSCAIHRHPILGPSPLEIARVVPLASHKESCGKGGDTVIVLPVPYDMLKVDPFCSNKGFIKEPYFHDKSEVGEKLSRAITIISLCM